MTTNMNDLVGSLLILFNDSSIIPKPNSDYVGSLFFGPNQELVFRNNAPKGRIVPDTTFNNEKSFGNSFKRTKHYNINIDFFTVDGYVDSSGKKNTELINRYLEFIESAIINNTNRYGEVTMEELADVYEPQRAVDLENNVWIARKLLVLKERK